MIHTGPIAQAGARLTLPTANLLAAYDARSFVSVDGGITCSTWTDVSGNGWHASQGTAGSRPAISSTDGLPSLLFDGTNDYLAISGLTAAAGTKTAYFTVNPTAFVGSYNFLFDIEIGRWAGGVAAGTWGQFDSGVRTSGITPTTGLKRVTFEAATGAANAWVNGTQGTPAGWTAAPAIGGIFVIGAHYGGGALYFPGHILFAGIYGATHNNAVEAWETQEWGV